jgi:hypothetical protein
LRFPDIARRFKRKSRGAQSLLRLPKATAPAIASGADDLSHVWLDLSPTGDLVLHYVRRLLMGRMNLSISGTSKLAPFLLAFLDSNINPFWRLSITTAAASVVKQGWRKVRSEAYG